MSENDEYIDIDFPRSPPFWSLYRDRINGRNYVQHGEHKSLKKITLVRHDPEQPTDSHLSSETNYPYADPLGITGMGYLMNSKPLQARMIQKRPSVLIHCRLTMGRATITS